MPDVPTPPAPRPPATPAPTTHVVVRQSALRALRRPRCSACTPSGAARTAGTRPTAAAGELAHGAALEPGQDRHHPSTAPIATAWSRSSPSCASASGAVREGGGAKYVERHREQGKLPVRERIDAARRPEHAVPRAVAARRVGHVRRRRAGRGAGHGHRPRRRARGDDRRQRRDGEGRHLLPHHGQEARAGAADRARKPAAVRLPRRFRRRVPAAPGRGLSRPRALRAHLLQSGPDVGRADPADRRRHGLVHGRRRVRARDVRRDHHRQGHGHDLSRRAAAREGGDRRRSHGRGTGRRRRAHAHLRRRRLHRRRRRARAADGADDRLDAAHVEAAARRHDRARAAEVRPRRALRHRQRGSAASVRRARSDRAARGRIALRRVQAALRHHARDGLRAAARISRRHHRQQRRAVLRVGAQGDALHRALQPARHSARVPAEHHRVHGRQAVRARRHREGRRQDGARGRELGRAEVHRHHRRIVRRGQLRHVRTRVRAAPAVDVAERAHLRHGRRAGRVGARHRQARSAGARGQDALGRGGDAAIRAPILEKYDREGSPYYSTARLWDDGVLDPARTREALALGISASYNAPIPDAKFGIFRM